MLWLKGIAGSGKSTIAASVRDYCVEEKCLAAYLFFERGKSEPSMVIRTIAYNLALFDSSITSCIFPEVENEGDIASA